STFYDQIVEAIAAKWEIDVDRPWGELPEEHQRRFLYGTGDERVYVTYRNRMGRKRSFMMAFEGIVTNLARRYRATESSRQKERIESYMTQRPCPTCKGARLKRESLAVTVGEVNIDQFTRRSVRDALAFLHDVSLSETEQLIGGRVIREIRERL